MYKTTENSKWEKVKEGDGLRYQQESDRQTIASPRRNILIQLWPVEFLLHNKVVIYLVYLSITSNAIWWWCWVTFIVEYYYILLLLLYICLVTFELNETQNQMQTQGCSEIADKPLEKVLRVHFYFQNKILTLTKIHICELILFQF